MKRIALVILASVALFSSCVKEDREACPCVVRFDIGNMAVPGGLEEGVVDIYVFNSSGDTVLNEMRRYKEGLVIDRQLPRGDYRVAAYFSPNSIYGYLSQKRILVPWSKQGIEFYGSSVPLDTHCDYAYVCPRTFKQFSRITVYNVSSEPGLGQPVSFEGHSVVVSSPYGGYSLMDCSAVLNDLHFVLYPDSDEFTFILPRQADQGGRQLVMSVCNENSILVTLDLWRYLEVAAYPWEAEELPDVRIGVDFKTAQVHITVIGWGEEIVTSIM